MVIVPHGLRIRERIRTDGCGLHHRYACLRRPRHRGSHPRAHCALPRWCARICARGSLGSARVYPRHLEVHRRKTGGRSSTRSNSVVVHSGCLHRSCVSRLRFLSQPQGGPGILGRHRGQSRAQLSGCGGGRSHGRPRHPARGTSLHPASDSGARRKRLRGARLAEGRPSRIRAFSVCRRNWQPGPLPSLVP